jgi:exopolysaccharide biosynthesis WecB/TagA/CpsF family protein
VRSRKNGDQMRGDFRGCRRGAGRRFFNVYRFSGASWGLFSMLSDFPTRRILGINFAVGTIAQITDRAVAGGLVVAPSGPGLAMDLVRAPAYRAAVTTADLAITDSGWMVLLWRMFTGERLPRHSGLKLIRAVLEREDLKAPGAIFWVMPSAFEEVKNREWLQTQGFAVTAEDCYLAPHYAAGPIQDRVLVARLEARKPRVVMLAIGGGVQERLGDGLRAQLSFRPGILCLGAAIAFLSGTQAAIPVWADRMLLGWLFRLLSSPRKFWRRYWEALRLAPLLWSYRERLPDLRG